MRAVQFAEYGGPEVLEVVEIQTPDPGPGQVRVRVRAAGVNGIDWKIRAGFMRDAMPRSLPSGAGADAAGLVEAIGEGVEQVSVGGAVFGTGSSTYAESAVLHHWCAMPEGLDFEEAAGLPIPVETAVRILGLVQARSGETLLVSGAAGGVGSAVVQIAVARGVRVIGTASSGNHPHLEAMGAVATTYGEGLVERVRALAPDGVDAALDLAGSGVIEDLVTLAGDPLRVATIADFGAGKHGVHISSRPQRHAEAYAEVARLIERGAFSMPVAQTFSLAEAGAAQARSASGHGAGRIVITLT